MHMYDRSWLKDAKLEWLEVPQCSERVQSGCATTLHHLIIALHVGRDENNLGSKPSPRIFKKLHGVGPSSSLLRIPENHPLGFDVLSYQTCNRGSERPLLVRAYPYEKPVWALYTRGKCCSNTSPGADTNPSLKHCGSMPNASYFMLVIETGQSGRNNVPNFSSLVHRVLGGLATRSFVKSPCTPQIM